MRGVRLFRWQTNKLTDYQLFLRSCGISDCAEARRAFRVSKEAFEQSKDYYPSDKRTLRQVLLDTMMMEKGGFSF